MTRVATVPLVEAAAGVVEDRFAAASQRWLVWTTQRNRADEFALDEINDLHAVVEIVGDKDRAVIVPEPQSHRPAAELDAIEAIRVLEQLGIDVIRATIVLERQPFRAINE